MECRYSGCELWNVLFRLDIFVLEIPKLGPEEVVVARSVGVPGSLFFKRDGYNYANRSGAASAGQGSAKTGPIQKSFE